MTRQTGQIDPQRPYELGTNQAFESVQVALREPRVLRSRPIPRRVGLLRLISARSLNERWRRRDGRLVFGEADEREARRRHRRSEAISKQSPRSLAMSTVSVRFDTRMARA